MHLKKETPEAVQKFVEAFLLSMPTGKQNTFANRTAPDFAYIALREDQPVNLAGAFERPVVPGKEGYVAGSVKAFSRYANKTYGAFVREPRRSFCLGNCEPSDLGDFVPLHQVLEQLGQEISACVREEEV